MTFTPDQSNTMFRLAADLVNQTGRDIFLTGKAGTGKTTFLKYIRDHCHKQMAVVAPTGVAAINAGGVTLHSFFQLPFGPFLPVNKGTGFSGNEVSNKHSLVSRLRLNTEKRKLMQQLELLVIDEISMVRADLLDAMDTVLRFVRHNPQEKFGGVQVLYIGDMFQLPPVVKDTEWKILNAYYNSPYFFDSQVVKESPPLYIEFDKIYRQRDASFIEVLNQVRNNALNEEGKNILAGRFQPVMRRQKDDRYIILTTPNEQARNINAAQLQQLDAPVFRYEAELEDDFPEQAFPAEQVLLLKEGAQVMFIRNDSAEKGKRFYNGKIGTVSRLEEDKIWVSCTDLPDEIEVSKEKWENIRYSLDKSSQSMKEEVLGAFTQFPLRLAWAITIHKSQGLTFEKAIIDAGEAFAPGQVYVALSRCSSLEGMVLKSTIRNNSLLTDPRIIEFTRKAASSDELQTALAAARKAYQLKTLKEFFDYLPAIKIAETIQTQLQEQPDSFNKEAIPWIAELIRQLQAVRETAGKFHQWLDGQFSEPGEPDINPAIGERTLKAAAHFIGETEKLIEYIKATGLVTDSKLLAKELNDLLKELFTRLSVIIYMCKGFDGGFDVAAWHIRRKNFLLPSFPVNVYAGAAASHAVSDNPHPVLYSLLKNQRDLICARKGLPVYLVLSGNTLDEMARYLPQSKEDLRKITGMGQVKTEQYGSVFLDIILEYCNEYGLTTRIHEKSDQQEKKEKQTRNKKPASKKGDTHLETFLQFRKGKSIADIARERNLASSTIEGHLTRFVASGEIDILELVPAEKQFKIEAALAKSDGKSITPVKQELGNEISFTEIRWVLAARDAVAAKSTD